MLLTCEWCGDEDSTVKLVETFRRSDGRFTLGSHLCYYCSLRFKAGEMTHDEIQQRSNPQITNDAARARHLHDALVEDDQAAQAKARQFIPVTW